MPRKGNTPKREVLPDPVYGSVVVAKLINSIMLARTFLTFLMLHLSTKASNAQAKLPAQLF